MNKIFSSIGEGWPGFPRRSYGKLDQVEPLDAAEKERPAVFSLDVVDADWSQFASGAVFDLSVNPTRLQSIVSDYWSRLFARGVLPTDPYDKKGEQYNVVDKSVPPLMGLPMLPHLALRYTPIDELSLRFDAAYGIVQFWFGLSAAYAPEL